MAPRVATLLLLAIACSAGCKRGSAGAADAAPPPALEATPKPDSERAQDDLWKRAGDGDPVDLARLADREGASGLLDGLEEGGPIGVTALAALPFADDAEAAYQRLGEIVAQLEPAKAGPVVEAVAGIAARPRRQVEPVDPPGMRACGDALLDLARNTRADAKLRATAISTLRLLAERSAVEAGAIPTDLDPN